MDRTSLLAVHIRWGDKIIESELVPAATYLREVLALVRKHAIRRPVVFLSSEDAAAIGAFENAVALSSEAARLEITVISYKYARPAYTCAAAVRKEVLGDAINASWAERAAKLGWGHFRQRNSSSRSCLSTVEATTFHQQHNNSQAE